MNKFLGVLSVAAIALTATAGATKAAEYGPYVSGSLGYLGLNDRSAGGSTAKFDDGYAINGAVGYKYGFGLRVEGEFGYGRSRLNALSTGATNAPVSGADADIFTFTGNAFYDFKTNSRYTPYLGGGLGLAHQSNGSGSTGGVPFAGSDRDDFMFLLEAGVSVQLTDNIAVVPSYRYMQINNGSSGNADTTANIFKVGMRYNF